MTGPRHPELDDALDQTESAFERLLQRMKDQLPDEDVEPWELEREAFGIEPPQGEEDEEEAAVREHLPEDWREQVRRNWQGPTRPRKWRK